MLPFPSVEHVPHQLGFSAIGCNSQLQTITIRNFEWLISWPRVVDFFDSKLAHELFLLVPPCVAVVQASRSPLAEGVHPPALLVIQGSADHIVAPKNGVEAARLWAAREGAKPSPPRTVQRGKRYPATVTDYRTQGRLVVTLCEIGGLGHAWSGGAANQTYSDPKGPDASRMVWAFAAKQFATAVI